MRGSRAGFVVGPLVALLVVGGCSGEDPEVRIAPAPASTGSSPTVEPSPTPTGPTSARGPVGTVRHWIGAQNDALRTGDTAPMRDLSAVDCRGCDNFAEPIEQVYDDGGSYSTHGWSLVKAKVRSRSSDVAVVDTGISIAGGKTTLESGSEPVVYAEEKHIMVFRLVPDGNGWLISFIGFVS